MTLAQGSRHEVSFVPEVTPGTTPNTPAMKRFRQTSTGLNLAKGSFQSAELRADRQIQSFRHTSKSVGGPLAFEYSFGAFDDWLESALFGTWSSNILKAGVTPKFFSVERRFLDIDKYLLYKGVNVGKFSLSIPTEGGVTGTFDLIGRDMVASATSVGTPTDVALNEPFTSDGGILSEGGTTLAIVTALELSLDNGVAPNPAVGSNISQQQSYGVSNLTGTLTAYFDGLTLFNKFINETESSLSMTLVDPAGNDVVILIPRLKYSGAEVNVESGGSVLVSLPFQALRDPTLATNIQITR